MLPVVMMRLDPRPAQMLPDELEDGESRVMKLSSVGAVGGATAAELKMSGSVFNDPTSRIQNGSSRIAAAISTMISMARDFFVYRNMAHASLAERSRVAYCCATEKNRIRRLSTSASAAPKPNCW